MFSVFIMRQTTIVVSEKRVFCERPRVLSNAQEKTLSQHEENLRTEIDLLINQVENLTRQVTELEKASAEAIDLTQDESFTTTASVHSEDLSPVENGLIH